MAYGIGNWLSTLEIITQLAIFMNMGMLYFTSHAFHSMFIGVDYRELVRRIQASISTEN